MVFSSPIFLFLFLPLVLTGYFCLPGLRSRNAWLLFFSLVFYAWGEPVFVLLALASTIMNFFLGLWLDKTVVAARRKLALGLAIGLNIGLLAFFKYTNFVLGNLDSLLARFHLQPLVFPPVLLPIGISFFTFHAVSYIVDIYRRKKSAATNPGDVALYIFFFPQLIAGPILRWSAIAPQLANRTVTRDGFAEGVRRFVGGLAKKMIIANVVAAPADQIFALPAPELTPALGWFAVICYTLQIYFDFSGYSDMAVGLGKMFGFSFLENFDFPYIAQNVRDFWRRWHISLSTWFRDYVYIPLGGNRCSETRNYANLVLVFFLCGLWHGASWTFVVWGLYHGVFLVMERTPFGLWVARLPRVFRHIYALLAVMFGWVLFRAETFSQALAFFSAMFALGGQGSPGQPLARYLTDQIAWAILLGIICSTPVWRQVKKLIAASFPVAPALVRPYAQLFAAGAEIALLVVLMGISSAWLAGGTYNPFIYYRF